MPDTLKIIAVALALSITTFVFGKENIGTSGKMRADLKAAAATCNPATAQIDMEINNVRTTLLAGGDIWWDLNDAKYEIPKIDPPGSATSVHSLFAGAIWLGGIDAGGQLKLAAQTYRQTGNDFWPGPLDNNASVTDATCDEFDRHWKVTAEEIDELRACLEQGGGTCPANNIATSILEWPARGNQNARGANGNIIQINEDLAPFYSADGGNFYDPTRGDYPVIDPDADDPVYADEMIFWVYNDKGNIHTETSGQAIGVQVNALAFAFTTSDEVNDMTFYRYKLINKATIDISEFYMAQWVDADLGCFNNDYVGCDTTRSLGICYNGTASDPDCATPGYGDDPPMIGIDYFEGPLSDARLVEVPGEGGGVDTIFERVELGMSNFTYYNNDFTVQGNPTTAVHYYGYMTGFWKDNTPFTCDQCTGKGGSSTCSYMFPSDPPNSPFPEFWSECSCGNPPADRRFLQSSGPFTLEPGAVNNITVGAVWVRPEGVYPCPTFDIIGTASDKAQALFDNEFKLVDGPDAPTLVLRELDGELIISLTNSPTSNNVNESYNEPDPVAISIKNSIDTTITDTTFTFEGYKIYQLRNGQVTAQELDDVNKARLVAQFDVKNGVTKLVNFTFDDVLGADVPELMVDGSNDGISRTIRVVEDQFATEAKALVNHQTYYFAALAYAYNEYRPFDPQNPSEIGQKEPYKQGRRNYKIYSGIPHKPESGGVKLRASYGDGVKVKRVDGTGNGGANLELTPASVDSILQSPEHYFGRVEYMENMGPIDVKVYDPVKLSEATFLFTMLDTVVSTVSIDGQDDTLISPQAYWRLEATRMEGESPTEVYFAQRSIEEANEQLIEDFGISISLNQVGLPGKAPDCYFPNCQISDETHEGFIPANGFIEATMEFSDSEEQWLTGVQDAGAFGPENWIRAGVYRGPEGPSNEPPPDQFFYDDHAYADQSSQGGTSYYSPYDGDLVFGNMLDRTWAPYCLAANWRNNNLQPGFRQPIPPFSFGPAFQWKYVEDYGASGSFAANAYAQFEIPTNRLDNLRSVDLVLTSDQSKWTRCVVVETGEEASLNEGGAEKGNIRFAESWEIDGTRSDWENPIVEERDTGRSWFPGYAINVETGERLNIMFGENSWLGGDNGRDMIWNPTSTLISPLLQPIFGGGHYIYIVNTRYDEGEKIQRDMLDNFNFTVELPPQRQNKRLRPLNDSLYQKIMWVSMAMLAPGFQLDAPPPKGDLVPSDVKIRLRVNVPFAPFEVDGSNEGRPQYQFSTEGMGAIHDDVTTASSGCEEIRAVPNPYYAYSAYETSQIDNRIKITNLPNNCTVSIYTLSGALIRRFDRAIADNTSPGGPTDVPNLDNSISWNLKNAKNIPIASGLYLIHVEAPGVCEKVIKWFGAIRPVDLDSF